MYMCLRRINISRVIARDGMIVARDNIMESNSGLMGLSPELRDTKNKPNAVGDTRDTGIRTAE